MPGKEQPQRISRVLVITPECTALPRCMGRACSQPFGEIGGTGTAMAGILSHLNQQGQIEVHLAFPDYCARLRRGIPTEVRTACTSFFPSPTGRVHRAQDRIFYYAHDVRSTDPEENKRRALAFQREVIHQVFPRVRPDLVHCIGAMTGLIPAAARSLGIPSVFTLDCIGTESCTLAEMENRGIDPFDFWQNLYFRSYPGSYDQCRHDNPVDLLTSGVFSASRVHLFSPGFLDILDPDCLPAVSPGLRAEIDNKLQSRCVAVIPGGLEAGIDPTSDKTLARRYGPVDHGPAKKVNKAEVQRRLDLSENPWAPLVFCPIAPGLNRTAAATLKTALARSRDDRLQFVFQAPQAEERLLKEVLAPDVGREKWAVCSPDEHLLGISLAGADFFLGLSAFNPAGMLPKIAGIYGALPIVPSFGGSADCVWQLNADSGTGNGFLFRRDDPEDLLCALHRALSFQRLPAANRSFPVSRMMQQSANSVKAANTADKMASLYASILRRPLLPQELADPFFESPAGLDRAENE